MRQPVLTVPSPMLPPALGEDAAAGLHLRRFGEQAAGLDVDFAASRPQLVSDLLSCCLSTEGGATISPAMADELSLSTRIVCLLLLTSLEGRDELDLVLDCPSCNERIELTLAIEEAIGFAPRQPDLPLQIEVDGSAGVTLRRPTGADQRAWLQSGYIDEDDARLGIVRSLLLTVPEELPRSWLEPLEALLEEHDPLVCFSLETACPFCAATSSHEVPLTDLALRVLQVAQFRLLEAVHRLAARYGWSEAEVLAVPAWRRERYLQLIEAEAR